MAEDNTLFKTGKSVHELKTQDSNWRSRGTPGTEKYVKKPRTEGGHYTYKEKLKVVQTYLSTQNLALTSRLTKVPEITLYSWKKMPWWSEMMDELVIQDKVETNKTLKRITEQALNTVADRLTSGNHQYDQKSGEIVRVPVNVRDAHRIAVDMLDAQSEIDKRIDVLQHRDTSNTNTDVLAKLAEQLAKFAKGTSRKTNEIDITDAVEVMSAANGEQPERM